MAMECHLDVVLEQGKPPTNGRHHTQRYAEQSGCIAGWETNKEKSGGNSSPPSPPLSLPPSDDELRQGSSGRVHVTKTFSGRGRPGTQSRATRAGGASSKNGMVEPPSLNLKSGEFIQYLVELRAKQLQISELQNRYESLLDKVQFRNTHPDWSEEIPEPSTDAPLLTLRNGQVERELVLEPMNLLSPDVLQTLPPNDAWYAVVMLRKQVLDLQVALMYSRIQVKYRELRLQEVTAEHRRYKASVRDSQRKAEKRQQNSDLRIRRLERRCSITSTSCSQWRLKSKLAEKTGSKKKRRSELLAKGLEQIFTPMQLRVIRSGKKPRWTEEDIRRAIELKRVVTKRGYAFIRNTMKIPLPSPVIMKRGAHRFDALKPLYEQMVAANVLKYSTKKKPKVPDFVDHQYNVELTEPKLEMDLRVPEENTPVEEAAFGESTLVEPAPRKPIKRRRKRATAQEAPLQVEFEDPGTVVRSLPSSLQVGAAATAQKRARTKWSDVRRSWGNSRLYEGHDQTLDEYEQRREERHRRPRLTWSADTIDFL